MMLKKMKRVYPIQYFDEIRSAMIDEREKFGICRALCQVSMDEMRRMISVPDMQDVMSVPNYFAIERGETLRLYVHPLPDKSYKCELAVATWRLI